MKNKIKTLVFDLDDTLYSQSLGYHDYAYSKVYKFVKERLKLSWDDYVKIVGDWNKKHGSTYELYKKYGTSFEEYIAYVCEHDMSKVKYNEELEKQLKSLHHKKIIYTDASRKHAIDTLKQLKLDGFFEEIYTIKEAGYVWKDFPKSFDRFLKQYNLKASETAIFEDNLKNLKRAKEIGMCTIFISEKELFKPDFCDFMFYDINSALKMFL